MKGGITMGEENTTNVARKTTKIGYFDGVLNDVGFNDGDNIQTLINKANISFGDGQTINDEDGNEVAITDQAEADKVYYICGNYKQGN